MLLIGFFGFALTTDKPEMLLIKAKIFFWGIVVSFILMMVDDIKNDNYV